MEDVVHSAIDTRLSLSKNSLRAHLCNNFCSSKLLYVISRTTIRYFKASPQQKGNHFERSLADAKLRIVGKRVCRGCASPEAPTLPPIHSAHSCRFTFCMNWPCMSVFYSRTPSFAFCLCSSLAHGIQFRDSRRFIHADAQ